MKFEVVTRDENGSQITFLDGMCPQIHLGLNVNKEKKVWVLNLGHFKLDFGFGSIKAIPIFQMHLYLKAPMHYFP